MANNEQYLDRNGVSHFYLLIKQKLTAFFKTIFVEQQKIPNYNKDGYGLSQNDFTNSLKEKLENIENLGSGDVEDEIYIITATRQEDNTFTITREDADIVKNYNGEKPLYAKVSPIGVYGLFEGDNCFIGSYQGEYIRVTVDTDTLICNVDNLGELLTEEKITQNVESLSEFSVPSARAVESYVSGGYIKKSESEKFITIDENGKVPTQYLPSYVDDVIEGYYGTNDDIFKDKFWDKDTEITQSGHEIVGETGKIYLDLKTNNSYRWTGSVFLKLESSVGISPLTNEEIEDIISSVDSIE